VLKIIVTITITIVVLLGILVVYITSGAYDVSQLSKHNDLSSWVINTTLEHSIQKRMKDIKVPGLKDSAMVLSGFVAYHEMCEGCHGAPGVEPWEMAKGLYPDPPKMYQYKDTLDPKETFWIIKNGIKFTSMPAFGPTHSDNKIWNMTAFLTQKFQKMTPEEYKSWESKFNSEEEDENAETSFK
jgi:mono/diheme cytochrome c family protein